MRNAFPLYRWFRDVPISRKLYFTVGTMAVLIGLELFVLLFSLSTLSSLRAYVGGEGLWSKAEKEAVFHLYRYGVAHIDKDYQLFQQFMRVPIGDAKARRALLAGGEDVQGAYEGFLEGRNHPDDIGGMTDLFIRFGNVSYLRKAIRIWGDAQDLVMQLLPIAANLRQEVDSPTPSQDRINGLLAAVYTTNERVTAFEDQFSFTLGEGSRWLEGVVLRLLFTTALTVEVTGLLLALSVSRGIQKGLANIIEAADGIAEGKLGSRAAVLSRDEIGVVAGSFNAMAHNLQARVGELDRANRGLEHEIGERQRAEGELRDAVAQLETTLHELERQTAERLRTEEMLRESAKMQAMGQLTGGIAHDFNNLLGVVIGSVEHLMDAVRDRPEYAELAQEILDSALHGSELTRRLLAVGRKQPLQPRRIDLNVLLSDHVELLRRTLGEMIDVRVAPTPDLWPISADPSQILDVLLNLALNARDAMPQGGRLTLEAVNVHLDARDNAICPDLNQGDYVALAVTDTGVGMPEEVAGRATEPFFTTKPPAAGSGLGLSMAYGFAKQSGGHLEIESKVGAGTTIRMFLPRVSDGTVPAPAARQDAPDPPRGSETVLLVDDNRTLLRIAQRYLLGLGYSVIPAASGPAALAVLQSGEACDLLFTDIVMPDGMNGYDLAKAARGLRPGLKVLYTTGYAGGHEEDATHLLRKPYTRHALACAVRRALDESEQLMAEPPVIASAAFRG